MPGAKPFLAQGTGIMNRNIDNHSNCKEESEGRLFLMNHSTNDYNESLTPAILNWIMGKSVLPCVKPPLYEGSPCIDVGGQTAAVNSRHYQGDSFL